MSRTTRISVNVTWGDCDPADIVYFPNFNKWMDSSSQSFFLQCGVPRWRELENTRGIVGTPLLEINCKFYKPATYGDTIEVATCVEEWRPKVFIQHHQIFRGDLLLCEGRETRAFVQRVDGRLKAIPVPEDLKAMCL